jgi:hypothetical protein
MKNPPERNESEIHIIHNGKFYFSIFEGRHPSWCNLKILQGKNNSSLVILSQPQGYIGTFIASAAEHIATQVVNLFGLDPALTLFIHYMPPTVDKWPQDLAEDDPIAEFVRYFHGPSDEKFDQVTFQWMETDTDEPTLERYYVQVDPYWKRIYPGDVIKLLEQLNRM